MSRLNGEYTSFGLNHRRGHQIMGWVYITIFFLSIFGLWGMEPMEILCGCFVFASSFAGPTQNILSYLNKWHVQLANLGVRSSFDYSSGKTADRIYGSMW